MLTVWIWNAVQKPLRRIDIEEVSGMVTVPEEESGASKPFVEETVRDAEDGSSPLSTSPSAKMIKIEEIADIPSQTPEQYVAQFSYRLKPFETIFLLVFLQFYFCVLFLKCPQTTKCCYFRNSILTIFTQ